MPHDEFLRALGQKARAARLERDWTIREVADRSGLSSRFLVHLEAGRGNISVRRLADLAGALGTTAAALLEPAPAAPRPVVALLGLRGAGKTTVGRRLARRLRVQFVELDRRIEEAAELSLAELFALHGEDYYRRLERDALERVLGEGTPMVLAAGGGLVTVPGTFDLLRRAAVTIWLRARAEDHWDRVRRQGDRRLLADHPRAMASLRALLAAREPLYAHADHQVDTSGAAIQDVVDSICSRLRHSL